MSDHEFWIFRQNDTKVPRGTLEFKEETGIDLAEYTQHNFSTGSELVRILLTKCD